MPFDNWGIVCQKQVSEPGVVVVDTVAYNDYLSLALIPALRNTGRKSQMKVTQFL